MKGMLAFQGLCTFRDISQSNSFAFKDTCFVTLADKGSNWHNIPSSWKLIKPAWLQNVVLSEVVLPELCSSGEMCGQKAVDMGFLFAVVTHTTLQLNYLVQLSPDFYILILMEYLYGTSKHITWTSIGSHQHFSWPFPGSQSQLMIAGHTLGFSSLLSPGLG